jgi:hypothetical protein
MAAAAAAIALGWAGLAPAAAVSPAGQVDPADPAAGAASAVTSDEPEPGSLADDGVPDGPVVDPAEPALDPDSQGVVPQTLTAIVGAGVTQDQLQAALDQALAGGLGSATVTAFAAGEGDFTFAQISTSGPATSEAAAASLTANRLVEAVDYGLELEPEAYGSPNDPYYAGNCAFGATAVKCGWWLDAFPGANFAAGWSMLNTAQAASTAPIAVLDSGFDLTVADRCSNIVPKYDYGDDDSNVTPTPLLSAYAADHGTSVAGMIGACTNNAKGIAGAAYDPVVWIYKVTSTKSGMFDELAVLRALRAAADDGAKVVNMSFIFKTPVVSATMKMMLDYALSRGVVLVAAVGNTGDSTVLFPAGYDPVIAVGSTAYSGTRSTFSTANSKVDLAAPGQWLFALVGSQGNRTAACGYNSTHQINGCQQGTSFAAPLVAAAASLVLRVQPGLSPAQVESILTATARDLGAAGRDDAYGWGLLDAKAAMDKAKITTPNPVSPTTKRNMWQITLSPDMNFDGRGEILAMQSNGQVVAFPFQAGNTLGEMRVIWRGPNSAWNYRITAPGDWDGDGKADLVFVKNDGDMWLAYGSGNGGLADRNRDGYFDLVQIGRGWAAYQVIPAGDLSSDGINDMLAIDTSGRLWLYEGNGRGAFKQGAKQVGKGWQGKSLFAAGDLNGDKKNDILMVNDAGDLYAYLGRGDGTFKAAVKVGHGWQGCDLSAGADLNGDRLADIVGRVRATGALLFYPGRGGGQFGASKQIGKGW